MFFNKKSKLLKEILDDSKELLSGDDYENALILVDNNESLLALELVCEQLYEYDVNVPMGFYEKIESAGKYYDLDAKKLNLVLKLVVSDS